MRPVEQFFCSTGRCCEQPRHASSHVWGNLAGADDIGREKLP
jgi:hypothetical protein